MAEVAVKDPFNGTMELAGPEPIRLDELVRRFLSADRDGRTVTTDAHAGCFGTTVNDQSLTPGDHPRLGPTRFEDWLRRTA
jgi:hypothetical protein